MAAYIIAEIEVKNPDKYSQYRDEVPKTVNQFGGRYIIRGNNIVPLEGDWEPERLVVIEFPDMASLKRWYESDKYKSIRNMRITSTSSKVIAIDGAWS